MMIKNRHERRGTIVVAVAVGLVAILAIVTFAIDGGMMLDKRRHLQATADAGALAAAAELYTNYTTYNGADIDGDAAKSAKAIVIGNGYDVNDVKIDVNIPPESGSHAGKAGYAEVILEYAHPSFFGAVLGQSGTIICARAVARGMWGTNGNGIIVLDPESRGALNVNGNGEIVVSDAGIVVDSKDNEAGTGVGNAILKADVFRITGNVNDPNYFDGTLLTGMAPIPDPLRYLPVPDPTEMTVQSNRTFRKTQGLHIINPGVYVGGISFSGHANLVMMPGIYYMDGGGFSFSGQGTLTGMGVMIYNAPSKSSDVFSITGQGLMTLTGPTSGPYKGVTFFQDRTSTAVPNIEGNGLANISGTFYAANALVQVSGNGDVGLGAQYISRYLTIGGNGNVNIVWRSDTTAPVRILGLVE